MHQYLFHVLSDKQVYNIKGSHFVSVSLKSDPFGGDPFKGSDPFAADSFFQAAGAPFSSEDPFSASADPFGTTTGAPEPDLFAAKPNDAAAAPAAGPDPFTSKLTNPASAPKDPFSSSGNNKADSDPFVGKVNATGEADPFGSPDGGTDPFSCSPPSYELAVVSRPAVQPGHNALQNVLGMTLTIIFIID